MNEALFSSSLEVGRQALPIMVVHSNGGVSTSIRASLKTLGFNTIVSVPSHSQALEKLRGRRFGIIFFDCSESDMKPVTFVEAGCKLEPEGYFIALSHHPKVDDVFGLLKAGGRGFIKMPFTMEMIECAIIRAVDGPPFSEAVLQAPDRNAALAALVLNTLYKVTVLQRQARKFPSAERHLRLQQCYLEESMELARVFCEGNDQNLIDKIMEGCITRSEIAATKLGRTRKQLEKKRKKQESPREYHLLDSSSVR